MIIFFHVDLNEDQQGIEELARKFAREEILPIAADHDKSGEASFLFILRRKPFLKIFEDKKHVIFVMR